MRPCFFLQAVEKRPQWRTRSSRTEAHHNCPRGLLSIYCYGSLCKYSLILCCQLLRLHLRVFDISLEASFLQVIWFSNNHIFYQIHTYIHIYYYKYIGLAVVEKTWMCEVQRLGKKNKKSAEIKRQNKTKKLPQLFLKPSSWHVMSSQ